MIRYLCAADGSPVGKLALAYADAFARAAIPFRIVAQTIVELGDGEAWDRHHRALVVPMAATAWVNVVCVDAAHWGRLHTTRVTNLLITDTPPPRDRGPAPPYYDDVITPTPEIARLWAGRTPQVSVVPPDALEDLLREVFASR